MTEFLEQRLRDNGQASPPRPDRRDRDDLRNALNVLLAIDARYEWRDESGVVVLRPAKALLDGDNPLFQLVPSVKVQDASAIVIG
jgi:hypothetical protein